MLLDDDTVLDEDFFIRHDLLADPKVGGYAVAIGVDRSPPFNIWEVAIDFEYRSISHAFGARATCSSIPFCHGICAVYKLKPMLELYKKNWSLPGGLPFGEDSYAGVDFREAGYKLLQDNANLVLTYSPRRFLPPLFKGDHVQGYGANCLWKQRACRWFLGWPRRLPRELWLVFNYNAGSWYGNVSYRIFFAWSLFLDTVSVLWVPYTLYVFMVKGSWIVVLMVKGILSATSLCCSMLRIVVFPSKLRQGIHPMSPVGAAVLGMANNILRFFGFIGCIYWFIPLVQIDRLKVIEDEEEPDKAISDIETSISKGSSTDDTADESYEGFIEYLYNDSVNTTTEEEQFENR